MCSTLVHTFPKKCSAGFKDINYLELVNSRDFTMYANASNIQIFQAKTENHQN